MNDHDSAAKLMINNVVDLCKAHVGDLANIPSFNQNVDVLSDYADNLNSLDEQIESNTSALTNSKNIAKVTGIELGVDYDIMILACAGNHPEIIVPPAVRISESNLYKMSENKLGITLQKICNFLGDNAAGLAEYGLRPTGPATFDAAIKDFEKKLNGTPEFHHIQEGLRAQFTSILKLALNLLETTMDPNAKLLRKSNPALFNLYFQTRKIVLKPRHTRAFKCSSLNAETKEVMAKVKWAMIKTANEDGSPAIGDQIVKYTGITTDKGISQKTYISPGTYRLTAIFPGFTAAPGIVYIRSGLMTSVQILLTKI